ncbi:MAG: nicotinate phosphoribosyltransferase [Bacilli bacterium]|nr:nicotinate phosphoribosyltransferase [Bacilli bacterium]
MTEIEKKILNPKFRLTDKTFNFPQSIASHFYTANYFVKTDEIIQNNLNDLEVTMQFFQRKDNVMVAGIDEAIALIHTFGQNVEKLHIEALHDGDIVNANEPVLKIKGRYVDFGYLESLIDGILTRRSNVATNTHDVLVAAGDTEVFSMADRQDDYLTQAGDGYASFIAGIKKFSTDAQGSLVGIKGMGTMPHALIAMCDGDLVKACELYNKTYPNEKISALIDYTNDCVSEALRVARHFGPKLGSVRLDTSLSLLDEYFVRKGDLNPENKGVSPLLVSAVREALDNEGFKDVKIVVSSSFNPQKIKEFKDKKVPVDLFGVGSYIVNTKSVGFTGDVVAVNGKPQAKVGRKEYFSDRLEKVIYKRD